MLPGEVFEISFDHCRSSILSQKAVAAEVIGRKRRRSGLAVCRWSPALLSTIRAGASSVRRGIETDADCPAILPPLNGAVLTGVKRERIALLEPAHRVLTMPVITPI